MQNVGSTVTHAPQVGPLFASRLGAFAQTVLPFIVVGTLWEMVARLSQACCRTMPGIQFCAW